VLLLAQAVVAKESATMKIVLRTCNLDWEYVSINVPLAGIFDEDHTSKNDMFKRDI
jgi:hypothetical protein